MKVWLCVLALLFGVFPAVRAEPTSLIVILLPGTSLQEWQTADAPNLQRLMQTGALAVMNTRTARLPNDHTRESPDSTLRTLGAGARATSVPGQSAGYDLHYGNLADTLAARGIVVQAGGGPAAALVAAAGDGRVSRNTVLVAKRGVCVIWDAGPDIAKADALVGEATAQISRQPGRLIVLSPYANDGDYAAGHRLTPILEWGPGVPTGVLYSPSTRRAGLVTNTDFAPSVAEVFSIPREAFKPLPFGYVWNAKPSAQAASVVGNIEAQSVRQMFGMRLLPYLAAGLAIWIIVCTWLIFRGRQFAPGSLLPIATLTAALISVSATSFGLAGGVILATAWLATKRFGVSSVVVTLAALCAMLLSLDMLTGNHGMHQSLLGYSAIEGARYYGLGNEAMGVLIGAALVTAARLWPERRPGQWMMACALGGLSLLLGTAGAKAGGLLVSVAAFGTFVYRANGGRWSGRTVFALCVIVVAMMTALALADAFLLPHSLHSSSSHIGEAVRRIACGGASEALDVIQRKLIVESRLAYHSAWALLLWGGLSSLWALWKRSPTLAPTTVALRQAGLVGIGACLLLNDAGVVAAALFVSLLWSDTTSVIKNAPASA